MSKFIKNILNKRAFYIIAGWLLILWTAATDMGLTVPRYEIITDKVEKSVRIVLLTDFHSSGYGKDQQVLTDVIKQQKPDVILMVGDIADDVRPHENTEELIAQLGGAYPCFYVTGNHEEWSGEVGNIKDMFRAGGISVMEGDSEVLTLNGQKIRISGVDNTQTYEQITACFENTGDGIFTVFMAHRPDRGAEMYSHKGFDLVVCGHAHGGQVIIPHILNGLYAPDQGLFPKYAGGRYTFDGSSTEMIVSRGLCKNILPRVFDPPEVVVIDVCGGDTE